MIVVDDNDRQKALMLNRSGLFCVWGQYKTFDAMRNMI